MADAIYYILLPVIIFILLNTWDSISYDDTGINNAFDALLCPSPEFTGLWQGPSGIIMRTGMTYNVPNKDNSTITLTCTPVHTPAGLDYCYGCPAGAFFGNFIFIADGMSEGFYKIGQFFFMVALVVTPPTTFLSITFLIPVFIGLYMFIGYGIYRLVSGIVAGLIP